MKSKRGLKPWKEKVVNYNQILGHVADHNYRTIPESSSRVVRNKEFRSPVIAPPRFPHIGGL